MHQKLNDVIMAHFVFLNRVICSFIIVVTFHFNGNIQCSTFKGRIKEHCPPAETFTDPVSGTKFMYARPDLSLEDKFSSLEEIYGERCFSLALYGYLEHFSVHVSLVRKLTPFCTKLTVTGVEMIAYGHVNEAKRHLRTPVGTWTRFIRPGALCARESLYHIKLSYSGTGTEVHTDCMLTPGYLNVRFIN